MASQRLEMIDFLWDTINECLNVYPPYIKDNITTVVTTVMTITIGVADGGLYRNSLRETCVCSMV